MTYMASPKPLSLFPAIVCGLCAAVLFLVLHGFAVYLASASGVVAAVLTLCLPIVAEIYWMIDLWTQTGSALNVLTVSCFAWLLLAILTLTLLRVGR